MKHILILIISVLLFSPTVHASWFSKDPDPLPEYKQKITSLENQLSAQSLTLNHWQIATGSLGIGSVLLLIIGTALGAHTRKHHYGTGRMGSTTGLNGRQPQFMGEAAEKDNHATLAA